MYFHILSTIFLFKFAISANINVYVNSSTPLHIVSDRYIGLTLDTVLTYTDTWDGMNLSSIVPLIRGLGPGYLRFGGTAADRTYFVDPSSSTKDITNITYNGLTAQKVDLLYNMVNNSGWRLIFDFNQLLRTGTDIQSSTWNSTNAQEFINYVSSKGYEMDFELGNEPDQYFLHLNFSLSSQQIANDYKLLRNILNNNSLYKNSLIIGPSVASGDSSILPEFLEDGGGSAISVLTFHHYSFSGYNVTIADYLNISTMDEYLETLIPAASQNFTHKWNGETAADWCSCTKGYSDTFLGGFLWLDKLGLSALHGMEAVLRQSLYGAYYGILNYANLPRNDYWLSFLYKKLVGTQVYGVSFNPVEPNLRLYAASSRNSDGIVVYGINVANSSHTLDFPQISNKQITTYIIKEGEPGNLQSNMSSVNGQIIEWTTHQSIVNIKGQSSSLPLEIPAYSQFFVVLGQETAQQCPQGWYKESAISNKCIKFISDFSQPWFAANFDCTTFGINTTILSIANAFENSEIVEQATNAGCNQFYMGLYRNGSNWAWSNGDSNTYRNWQNGFPTSDTTQNCVIFNSKTGSWANTDCDSGQCYVCQQYL